MAMKMIYGAFYFDSQTLKGVTVDFRPLAFKQGNRLSKWVKKVASLLLFVQKVRVEIKGSLLVSDHSTRFCEQLS